MFPAIADQNDGLAPDIEIGFYGLHCNDPPTQLLWKFLKCSRVTQSDSSHGRFKASQISDASIFDVRLSVRDWVKLCGAAVETLFYTTHKEVMIEPLELHEPASTSNTNEPERQTLTALSKLGTDGGIGAPTEAVLSHQQMKPKGIQRSRIQARQRYRPYQESDPHGASACNRFSPENEP
ncbi:hypothetical protein C8J56DRAFT_899316 [Mycena floridula]|nr:hypothetical protein C8J56DRAFT_899316 [Mycena floridula]